MMGRGGFVVDTSVAMKWLIEEDDSDKASLLRDADLAAPALLRVEASNVLRTLAARGALTQQQAVELFQFLQSAPVLIVDHDELLESRALELALALRHPVYDCLYLALAERMHRTLITADRRFFRSLAGTEHAGRAVELALLPDLPAQR